jgi:hypothetical protein
VGYQAAYSNATGVAITAFGARALYATTASDNCGIGTDNPGNYAAALESNTTGRFNTAVATGALGSNSTGSYNTGLGHQSLASITTSLNNTAVGYQAGQALTTSGDSTYIGYQSGYNTTGNRNQFFGYLSGKEITTGSNNVILGRYDGNQGGLDIRTSSNNIVLSDGDGNPRLHWEGSNGRWVSRVATNNVYQFRFLLDGVHANPYGLDIRYLDSAPDNQSGAFLVCVDSVTDRLVIYNDGDVVNHDNSYGAISDVKLKEQITDASSQWDDIKALTVRKYKMKSDVTEKGDSDDLWRLGVVAQEVEAAGMSGLVKESPDRGADNNDLGTTTKEVKYSILYMKAVKALQEAMERIETLEAKVAALESN